MKLSPKYQVVIPERVREALGLRPGAEIDVIAKGGVAYLVPVRSEADVKASLAAKALREDKWPLRDKKDRA